MKQFIIVGVVVLVCVGAFFLALNLTNNVEVTNNETTPSPVAVIPDSTTNVATTTDDTEDEPQENKPTSVLGKSGEGRDITAYHFGTGDAELLFVGGIHGGYSWNTVLVAYELIDHLEKNPSAIPDGVRVTVIPVLNPDGLFSVVGKEGRFTKSDIPASPETLVAGRFNADNVDLNRNFDCDWEKSGTWQSRTVSGGDAAFSEPESQALREYVLDTEPTAVVVWYSAAGGVFASNCHNGILPDTQTITNLYATASGYKAYKDFDFYEVTGDAVNWLAKNNIPAISVLLTTHTDVEWDKNRAGIEALLKHYGE